MDALNAILSTTSIAELNSTTTTQAVSLSITLFGPLD